MEQFIQDITVRAGKRVLSRFGKTHTFSIKKHGLDVVTEADMISNASLLIAIKKQFPGHGIISEETGAYHDDAEYVWIIDPIDGTLNFSKHIPLFAVMVALQRKGVIVLSCVYNPVTHELYFAKRGTGAYLNGQRIHCSRQTVLDESVGCVGNRLMPEMLIFYNNFAKRYGVRGHINALDGIGTSCVYVADGRKDWCVIINSGHIWDYAAPSLILTEAGCTISNRHGRQWKISDKEIVAANKKLHPKLIDLIQKKRS